MRKEIIIKRINSTINVLKHLVHECPDQTELLEEQIANLEFVVENHNELKEKQQTPCCLSPCCDCSIYDGCIDERKTIL